MFEIHVVDTDISTGSIPITWCIDRAALSDLKEYPDANVVVVVKPIHSTKPNDFSETRYVFPLRQMTGYVSFRYPGRHSIKAFVSLKTISATQYIWFKKAYPGSITKYDKQISPTDVDMECEHLSGDEKDYGIDVRLPDTSVRAMHKLWAQPRYVDVPKDCFAKEPSEWEMAWATWMITNSNFDDQCSFRRRRMFAWSPIQVIPFIFYFLAKLVSTVFAFSIGLRNSTLKFLVHPIKYSFSFMMEELFERGSYFLRPEPEKYKNDEPLETFREALKYAAQRGWPLVFTPLSLFFIGLFTYHGVWWQLLYYTSILLATFLFLGFIIGVFATSVVKTLVNRLVDWYARRFPSHEIEQLVCTGEDQAKPVKPTIKLRYYALKSKICRPFAG